jgi:hypothetical protein
MRQRLLITLSLLIGFSLAGTVAAAPPPGDDPARGEQVMTKERIEGRVQSVTGQKAIIRTNSGRNVDVFLGPPSYWRQKGYVLHKGTPVRVEGWHREYDNHSPIFAGGIWGPDFYFELTNGSGFPYWADGDDYWDGWYPTWDYYNAYYCGPAPYAYGPPPAWWWGAPPPVRWYRHHHFYGRPGFRWGWNHRFAPPRRPYEHGPMWHDRGGHGDWHDGNRGPHDGHNNWDHQDQRDGRRGR